MKLGYDFYTDTIHEHTMTTWYRWTVTYKHSGYGGPDEWLLTQAGNSGKSSHKKKYLEQRIRRCWEDSKKMKGQKEWGQEESKHDGIYEEL